MTGSRIRVWYGDHPNATVNSVAFSVSGTHVIASFSNGTVEIWDTIEGHVEEDVTKSLGTATLSGPVAFSSSERGQIVCVASGSTICIWDRITNTQIKRLQEHTDDVVCIAFSPDGSRIVSGSLDRTVRLWVVESPNGCKGCKGCKGFKGSKASWDRHNGASQHRLTHKNAVLSVQVCGPRGVSLSDAPENAIYVWDSVTMQQIARLGKHKSHVSSVELSAGNRRLVSGSLNGRLCLWDYTQQNTSSRNRVIYIPFPDTSTIDKTSDCTITIDQGAFIIKNDNWPNGKLLCYYTDYTGAVGSIVSIETAQRGPMIWVKTGPDKEGNKQWQSLDFSRMISACFS
ncbi:hypothetical protein FRC02_002520 [Tulasnella sp. 418]|nr:hypothetical protein FRC02_002520 [Tulasnella sp. 418]